MKEKKARDKEIREERGGRGLLIFVSCGGREASSYCALM